MIEYRHKLERKQFMNWNLEHTYQSLSPYFHRKGKGSSFPKVEGVVWNRNLARELGIGEEGEEIDWEIFAGNQFPRNSKPIHQAYCGHQFGYFNILGDGRAILLGEQVTEKGRYDIQLKGSGRTPFSRGGDGRATLGPMLREYLISESMYHLGI